MEEMFCFQCEQTVNGVACTKGGACGKKPDVSNLQDELTEKLVDLSRIVLKNERTRETDKLIIDGLFITITNVNFDADYISRFIGEVEDRINVLSLQYKSFVDKDSKLEFFNISNMWTDNEDIRSLKSLILFGLRGMAAYTYHYTTLGYDNNEVIEFFYEALDAIGKNLDSNKLLEYVLKTGEINLKCMETLDKANTDTYGMPEPTKVTTNIEKGPFIVVSGHDLHDLYLLLEETKDKGIYIYTHGEMLPAHAYPNLKKYSHLKGNFGTAWQNQQKEFNNIPAPVLFTTNCIMPVKSSYFDRVFTTGVTAYPEMVFVDEKKDFTPVIEKALELGGYDEDKKLVGINGGETLTTGFARNTILSVADKVIDGVKAGKIKHFFLVGGCDGAKTGRNYYTEFVKKAPQDTIILTLACGKYRFNDLDLGTIEGLPRIMDMGQCNDAYSAIQVAIALSKAFDCTVNELPLTLVLSWYEQKAVCILLTLLYLGIKNIYIGPTLPAFISKNILNILVEKYNIKPIGDPEKDLQTILDK